MGRKTAVNIYRLAELRLGRRIDWSRIPNRLDLLAEAFKLRQRGTKARLEALFGFDGIAANPRKHGEQKPSAKVDHHHLYGQWTQRILIGSTGISPGFALDSPLFAIGGPGFTKHLFSCKAPADLLHYQWSPEAGWSAENLTRQGGLVVRHELLGTPTPVVGYGGALHVFGLSHGGALIRYFWTQADGWRSEDVSASTNASGCIGEPAVIIGPGPRIVLYTRDTSDRLLEFRREPFQPWRVTNLSDACGGAGFLIAGRPAAIRGPGNAVHVFARSTALHLVDFLRSASNRWTAEDLTQPVSGSTYPIIGDPTAVRCYGGTFHVFARTHGGQIAHWHWSASNGWGAENLSAGIGLRLAVDPIVMSGPGPRLIVLGRDFAENLVELRWEPMRPWMPTNVTTIVGLGINGRIQGMPAAYGGEEYSIRALARNTAAALVEFTWYPHQGWRAGLVSGPAAVNADPRSIGGPDRSLETFTVDAAGWPTQWVWSAGARGGTDDVDFDDVRQGAIGDCYFVASLAALAGTFPRFVAGGVRLVDGDEGQVRFFDWLGRARWTRADLSFAAAESHQLLFGDSKDPNEGWVSLVEKGYAIWKGGAVEDGQPDYDAIDGGYSHLAFRHLTGRRFTRHMVSSTESDALWNRITTMALYRMPMTASTYTVEEKKAGRPAGKLKYDNGLVSSHVYTILDAIQANADRFLLLRNPWGVTEPQLPPALHSRCAAVVCSGTLSVYGRTGSGELQRFFRGGNGKWREETVNERIEEGFRFRIVDAPAAVTGPLGAHFVFVRNGSHEVVQFSASPDGSWSALNLNGLPGIGNAFQITSAPVALFSGGNGLHVFGRNDDGDLIHFRGPIWSAENLTRPDGGPALPAIEGDPVIVDGPGSALHVFARGPDGDLIRFHYETTLGWSAENVSSAFLPLGRFLGQPCPMRSGPRLRVYARTADGRLVQFGRDPNQDWRLDTLPGRDFPVLGDPVGARHPGSYNLFARGNNGDLIHFRWTPQGGWRVENLTERPTIGSEGKLIGQPAVLAGLPDRWRVGVRNVSGQVRLYVCEPNRDWRLDDPSDSQTQWAIQDDPVLLSGPDGACHVLGRNGSSQLVHFDDAGGNWQAENVTEKTSLVPLAGSVTLPDGRTVDVNTGDDGVFLLRWDLFRKYFEDANLLREVRPESFIHLFACTANGEVVDLSWSAHQGWRSEKLSGRMGLSDGRPAVSHQLLEAMPHVFCRSPDGELLHLHWSGHPAWSEQNATASPGIGNAFAIAGPVAAASGPAPGEQHVFAHNAVSELIHHRFSLTGCSAENLTNDGDPMSYYPVAGTPQLVSGSDGALHVFCRSYGGQIIHHFPSPAGGWRRRNLSAGFGPPSNIYDDPSVWIGHNPDRLRIYGRNSAGCLIEYSRDPGEEWRVSNLTHQAGIGEAYRIAGRPIVVEGAGAMRRLLARNRDGDLVEYVLSDEQQWNAANLTTVNQLLVGHRFVGNPTTAVGYDGSLHVFVRSLSGDPVRYFWYAGSGWRCEYLAPRPGAGRFVGTPAVLAGPGPVLRLFTVGPNGDLLLYLREPGRPWQIQNMAPQIGAGIAAEGLAPPLYRSQPVRAWQW